MAVRNLEYDVMTVLQSKLEAAAVYDRYVQDAEQEKDQECRRLFEEIKKDDERHAERLRTQLKRLLGGGS
jgi:bacterioferritin (cytochrome b1)